MILIRVELHSANTGKVTEIARMKITNMGGLSSDDFGDYKVSTLSEAEIQKHSLEKRYLERGLF